jgi:hypothetical protein
VSFLLSDRKKVFVSQYKLKPKKPSYRINTNEPKLCATIFHPLLHHSVCAICKIDFLFPPPSRSLSPSSSLQILGMTAKIFQYKFFSEYKIGNFPVVLATVLNTKMIGEEGAQQFLNFLAFLHSSRLDSFSITRNSYSNNPVAFGPTANTRAPN